MEYMLLILVTFCVLAIVLGRALPRGRGLVGIGATVLIFLMALIAWWFALYFQLVPIDRWLAAWGIYRIEGTLGALIFLGPPVVTALTAGMLASYWKRGH